MLHCELRCSAVRSGRDVTEGTFIDASWEETCCVCEDGIWPQPVVPQINMPWRLKKNTLSEAHFFSTAAPLLLDMLWAQECQAWETRGEDGGVLAEAWSTRER